MQETEIEKRIRLLDVSQKAVKKIINVMYGSFGCRGSYFYNLKIAESYTSQAKHLILYTMEAINKYFQLAWHLDKELHAKLGIQGYTITPITKDIIPYGITDSSYIDFGEIIKSVNGLQLNTEQSAQFALCVIENRLSDFLANKFLKYAQSYGVENYMDFRLENISESIIFVAKSNYAYKVIYDSGIVTKSRIEAKGLPCVKPSHPKKAREILMSALEIIFDKKETLFIEEDIIPLLKKSFEDFKKADIDDICINKYVSSFNTYVLKKSDYRLTQQQTAKGTIKYAINNSTNQLHNIETEKRGKQPAEIVEECGDYYLIKGFSQEIHGCVDYNNNLLTSGSKDYINIKNNDKVKVYVTTTGKTFCYPANCFDKSICLPIDYNEQFFKVVISPLNSILEAIGKSEITKDFRRSIKYKKPSVSLIRKYGSEDNVPFVCQNIQTKEFVNMPKKLFKYAVIGRNEIPDYIIEEYKQYIDRFGSNLIIKPIDEVNN